MNILISEPNWGHSQRPCNSY